MTIVVFLSSPTEASTITFKPNHLEPLDSRINTLPLELLENIFLLSVHGVCQTLPCSSFQDFDWTALAIRDTCKLWYEITSNNHMQKLWSVLRINIKPAPPCDTLRLLNLYLRWSKNEMLDISLTHGSSGDYRVRDAVEQVLNSTVQRLKAEAHRWKRLKLYFRSSEALYRFTEPKLDSNILTNLESFDVDFKPASRETNDDWESLVQTFTQTLYRAPSLTELHLHALSDLTNTPCHAITKLCISSLNPSKFLYFLPHFTKLEHLELKKSSDDQDLSMSAPYPGIESAFIPTLKTLTLFEVDSPKLLQRLVVPSLEDLTIFHISSRTMVNLAIFLNVSGCRLEMLHLVDSSSTEQSVLLNLIHASPYVSALQTLWLAIQKGITRRTIEELGTAVFPALKYLRLTGCHSKVEGMIGDFVTERKRLGYPLSRLVVKLETKGRRI